jgi:hypothetical protein
MRAMFLATREAQRFCFSPAAAHQIKLPGRGEQAVSLLGKPPSRSTSSFLSLPTHFCSDAPFRARFCNGAKRDSAIAL